MKTISRRTFLEIGTSTAGGLLVSFYLPGCGRREEDIAMVTAPVELFELNAFVEIDTDGRVTLTSPVPEVGQGVKTSLPMILAEELDVEWERVRVAQAEADGEKYGWQTAGGSLSISLSWMPLRRAGAVARDLLVRAAAERWGVDRKTCYTEVGRVVHGPSGRELSYGELAEAASRLEAPDPETVGLKDPSEFRIIGQPLKGVEAHALVTGEALFGLDQRLPGMLYAAIERSPVVGGRVAATDGSRARTVAGVHDLVEMDDRVIAGRSNQFSAGVAVLADSTWAALEGRKLLEVSWDEQSVRRDSTDDLQARARRRLEERGSETVREDGDLEQALSTAVEVVEADYEVPMLSHAPMEPMNCVADVGPESCRILVPTQDPGDVVALVAEATGLPPEAVTVEISRVGGGFGRRLYVDYATEAAHLSQKTGKPVQVVWTREDDMRHDYYRTPGFHRLRAGLDGDGRVVGWQHRLVNPSRNVFRERDDEPAYDTELYPDEFPAAFVDHLRLEYTHVPFNQRVGAWRGIAHTANAFPIQSFVDELAHAAGRDPLDFRLQLLGEARDIEFPWYSWDLGRLLAALERVAEASGWGSRMPEGRGRGMAFYVYSQARKVTVVAYVMEVSVGPGGEVKVHRVVSAVDPGIVVNPNGLRAQMEGGIIDGLATALYGEITVDAGRVQQSNYDDYRLLSIAESPEIEVHILQTDNPPAGMGEPPLPPAAPALTNAIFAATGKRIRRLPIRTLDLAG
ncbi:MAG: molybdopterin cofactor-binding domain-containing protein [Thermoanaerobaculia bacterium]